MLKLKICGEKNILLSFQVHQGLLCCYCTKLFKKVSDLETHIRNAHRVPKRYYHNTKQFVSVSGSKYHLVCSICSDIISTKELDQHACKVSAKKQFDCPNQCGRVFPGYVLLFSRKNSDCLGITRNSGF